MAIRNTLTLGAFTLPGRESGAPSREVRQTSASLAGNCLNRVFWGVKDALASCPVAVPRCDRARCPHRAAAPSARCAAWHRAHHCALGRPDAAPCAAIGGARRRPRQNSQRVLLAITHAHYARPRGDAARWSPVGAPDSRPTAITPVWGAPPFAHAHYLSGAMVACGGSPPSRPYRTRAVTCGA